MCPGSHRVGRFFCPPKSSGLRANGSRLSEGNPPGAESSKPLPLCISDSGRLDTPKIHQQRTSGYHTKLQRGGSYPSTAESTALGRPPSAQAGIWRRLMSTVQPALMALLNGIGKIGRRQHVSQEIVTILYVPFPARGFQLSLPGSPPSPDLPRERSILSCRNTPRTFLPAFISPTGEK